MRDQRLEVVVARRVVGHPVVEADHRGGDGLVDALRLRGVRLAGDVGRGFHDAHAVLGLLWPPRLRLIFSSSRATTVLDSFFAAAFFVLTGVMGLSF
jgi:hypothetical protein